jgi:hypothetical protein
MMTYMKNGRFNRNEGFFGQEGQERIAASRVAVIGVGGLGTHVVQQLALLGVGHLALVDDEELDVTNRNRYVGARYDDPIPGTPKVDIGERIIQSIDPDIRVDKVSNSLVSEGAFNAVINADHVFGCLDNEGSRLILTELCAAYSRPYFDIASDIPPDDLLAYGGRVCAAWDGNGCLVCLNVLDVGEAQTDLLNPDARRNRDAIYGIKRELLGRSGPSVVSINGVIASLAVTEYMVAVTGIRPPQRILNYYGHRAIVTVSKDAPPPDCYYCKGLRGQGDVADVQRYIRNGVGAPHR